MILGEAALLRSLASGQLFHPPLRTPLRWRTALWLSFAGNGASIAVSLAIPLAVVGLLRCIP